MYIYIYLYIYIYIFTGENWINRTKKSPLRGWSVFVYAPTEEDNRGWSGMVTIVTIVTIVTLVVSLLIRWTCDDGYEIQQ